MTIILIPKIDNHTQCPNCHKLNTLKGKIDKQTGEKYIICPKCDYEFHPSDFT